MSKALYLLSGGHRHIHCEWGWHVVTLLWPHCDVDVCALLPWPVLSWCPEKLWSLHRPMLGPWACQLKLKKSSDIIRPTAGMNWWLNLTIPTNSWGPLRVIGCLKCRWPLSCLVEVWCPDEWCSAPRNQFRRVNYHSPMLTTKPWLWRHWNNSRSVFSALQFLLATRMSFR